MVNAWEAVKGSDFATDVPTLTRISDQINGHPAKLDDFKARFAAADEVGQQQLINELEWFFGFKPGYFKEDITAIPKGSRPGPTTYLTPNYISNHVAQFDSEGSAFIAVKSWTEGGNPAYITLPERKFVGLRSEMDEVIDSYRANDNDWTILRDELNLGPTTNLEGEEIYYIKIAPGDSRFSYEIPTGNEGGAIDGEWVAGGFTKNGTKESALVGAESVVHNKNINELLANFDDWEQLQ